MADFPWGHRDRVRFRDCDAMGHVNNAVESFDLEHVLAAGDRVVAEAKSVLVSYDYALGESVPVPDGLRERLSA